MNTDTVSPCPLVGVEWVVEALGCDPQRLRDPDRLRAACEQLLADLGLHRLGEPLWHRFPHPGGVTGLYLLTESHLACHTYPEHALATFNLYCCRPRPRWPWEERLGELLSAPQVIVRSLERGNFLPSPLAGEDGTAERPEQPARRPLGCSGGSEPGEGEESNPLTPAPLPQGERGVLSEARS